MKEYIAPKMTVVDMDVEAPLLSGSGPDVDEYNDEFGFNYDMDHNRKA